MLRWFKKNFSLLIVVVSIAAVVVIAFSNQELDNAWLVLQSLHPAWILGTCCCWLAYAGFESLGTWFYLRGQKFRIPFLKTFSATMIGFFYSNITPSAAGGQPMQVSALRRSNIPVSYGTTAVTVRFISNQFMVSCLSLVLFLLHRDFVLSRLEQKIWFFRVGWLVNFISVPVVLMAANHPEWIRAISNGLIHLLSKMRLLHHADEARARVWETLELYHEAMLQLIHRPAQILLQLCCSLLSLLGVLSAVIFVYHAFHLTGMDWSFLLTLSSMLFVSASYTPLPGASGAQEGGFLLYFQGVFTDGTIGLALLVWRFFTYYLFLFAGVFFVLADRLSPRKKKERQAQSARSSNRSA